MLERFQSQQVRPRAHGMGADIGTVEFHHLPRLHPEIGNGEDVEEVVVRLREPDAHRVAVDDADPADRRVVVELARLACGRDGLVDAVDAALDHPLVGRSELRIDQPADRECEVLRHEFAANALEGRVVREMNTLLEPQEVIAPAVAHFGHGFEQLRPKLCGARERVVGEQGVEDFLGHGVGVEVRDLRGIEVGFRDQEGNAQDLLRLGQGHARDREGREGQRAGEEAAGAQRAIAHWPRRSVASRCRCTSTSRASRGGASSR